LRIKFKEAGDMKNRADCLKEYGSDYMIGKKVDAGELYKVGKGIYSEVRSVPRLAVLSFEYSDAVITMHSAFYFYDLTDVIPDAYDLCTDRNAAKIRGSDIRQYFAPSPFFEEGAENVDYRGFRIRIYNRERMLIELLRYRTKLPFDYYKEVLHGFRRILPELNMQRIQDYAYRAPKSARIMELLQSEVL
jgi:hypothetical protein